jgi:hypothetical protein
MYLANIRGAFQDAHGTDPLAMITALNPVFWLILAGYVGLGTLILYFRVHARSLHVVFLCEIALILFWTPFLLSGFSWSPDSLFHGGIAAYLPDILGGATLPFSSYAASYPFSFLTTYVVQALTGLSLLPYSLYIYPCVFIVIFTTLAYIFVTRLIGVSNAFVSLLVALPALHFLEPHVSPYSLGTLFILTALIALTSTSRRMRGLFFLSAFLAVVTHPISPLSLGIFLLSGLFINFIHHRWTRPQQVSTSVWLSNMSGAPVVVLGIFWMIWTLNWAATKYVSVDYAISKILSLNFLQDLSLAAQFTGGGFIYQTIQYLSLGIYGIVGLFDLIVFLSNLRQLRRPTQDRYLLLKLFFSLSSILFAGYAYLLFLGTGEHVLLGRGLLFFIINSAIAFTLQLVHNPPTLIAPSRLILVGGLILLLFTTFPVAAYSKEAYNTHTPTSGAGLAFIGSHLDVSRYSLSMGADRQLAAYSNLSNGLLLAPYLPNMTEISPDYIALRSNSYFLLSMRYDLSFHDNRFTRLRDTLETTVPYSKVYTNALFDIYANPETE